MNEDQMLRPKHVKADGQTAYKRQLAYRHLGITPKDVQCIPFLAIQLRRIARVAGARPLDSLQSSDDPDARNVYSVYLSVPESYRKLIPVEAFCFAAGVSPWRILELITAGAVRQGAQASAIIASILHPSVVVKTVEKALQDDGTQERMMLHKAVGFSPTRG